jgi:hypothetical protein
MMNGQTLTGNHLENRKADTNEHILYSGPPLFGLCGLRSYRRSKPVETAVDAK